MSSKEYCQAKLVELCNNSGARKGFHNDLVRMLKHMKIEHQFDATACHKRDTFFDQMRGSLSGTPPSVSEVTLPANLRECRKNIGGAEFVDPDTGFSLKVPHYLFLGQLQDLHDTDYFEDIKNL
jgi:hypothetical protein